MIPQTGREEQVNYRTDDPHLSLVTCYCNCGCQKRTAVKIFLQYDGKCPDCQEGRHFSLPTKSEWEKIDSETKRLSSIYPFVEKLL